MKFAKAGGVIPTLTAQESGWVIMRVVTLHEDHYRAAISAPWYIEFDAKPRVSKKSVAFFQDWMTQYEDRLKKQSPENLQRHVPFVRAARRSGKRNRRSLSTEPKRDGLPLNCFVDSANHLLNLGN